MQRVTKCVTCRISWQTQQMVLITCLCLELVSWNKTSRKRRLLTWKRRLLDKKRRLLYGSGSDYYKELFLCTANPFYQEPSDHNKYTDRHWTDLWPLHDPVMLLWAAAEAGRSQQRLQECFKNTAGFPLLPDDVYGKSGASVTMTTRQLITTCYNF